MNRNANTTVGCAMHTKNANVDRGLPRQNVASRTKNTSNSAMDYKANRPKHIINFLNIKDNKMLYKNTQKRHSHPRSESRMTDWESNSLNFDNRKEHAMLQKTKQSAFTLVELLFSGASGCNINYRFFDSNIITSAKRCARGG